MGVSVSRTKGSHNGLVDSNKFWVDNFANVQFNLNLAHLTFTKSWQLIITAYHPGALLPSRHW